MVRGERWGKGEEEEEEEEEEESSSVVSLLPHRVTRNRKGEKKRRELFVSR